MGLNANTLSCTFNRDVGSEATRKNGKDDLRLGLCYDRLDTGAGLDLTPCNQGPAAWPPQEFFTGPGFHRIILAQKPEKHTGFYKRFSHLP